MKNDYNVAIVTNVIPKYRADMYRRLVLHYGDCLHIYCQKKISGMNLNLVHNEFVKNTTIVKTLSLKKEKFSWQVLPLFELFKNYEVIFFYGNPRVFSNVIWASLFKLCGKKVVLWGQYHTAGSNKIMEKIRFLWWQFFDYIFLYTKKEAEEYMRRFPKTRMVSGMNNGLNYSEIDDAMNKYSADRLNKWKLDNALSGRKILLSCARLDKKNKFDFFLECLKELIVKNPDLLWCVIGSGDEEDALKRKSDEFGLNEHVLWLGEIYDQDELAPWFLSSELLVHPGAIGLSLIHSMAYGLPVLTHDNIDMQMPEIAALSADVNSFLFKENSQSSMIESIQRVLERKVDIKSISENAKNTAKYNFNTRVMAKNFIEFSDALIIENTI